MEAPMQFVILVLAFAMLASAPAFAQHAHHQHGHGHAVHAAAGGEDAELAAQLAELSAAVERYRDFDVARREGWKVFGGEEPLMGAHYSNDKAPDYVHGQPLDFSRPNNLIYMTIDGRKELTGVAYVVRLGAGDPLPEGFAGRGDRWHVHDMVAAIEAATEDRPILGWLANAWLDGEYRNKGDHRGRLAMVHVWVTEPNPDGVFADHHRVLPYLALGMPRSAADGASVDAARGAHLALKQGCKDALDGRLWIATADRRQSRELHAVCRAAAETVQAVRYGPHAVFNARAEEAWRTVETAVERVLRPEQLRRVEMMSEHGHH
jgi:hypothetical protein